MTRTAAEMVAELGLMITAKQKWLDTHGKDWPKWDRDLKQSELQVLRQARELYQKKMEE